MKVTNFTAYFENPYQSMLYSGLKGRYECIRGDVDMALDSLKENGKALLHVHWEEHCLRACPTKSEAGIAAKYFIKKARAFHEAGGKIVWTIHNGLPHELQHPEVYTEIQKGLAELSDKILIHNLPALNLLSSRVPLDVRKVYFLPHPSYYQVYETEEQLKSGIGKPFDRNIILFGKLRRYKGADFLLNTIDQEFTKDNNLRIKICGDPLPNDNYVEELRAAFSHRTDVDWQIGYVANSDVPALLRAGAGVVIPYERLLTSGVMLLCLSLAVPTVAPSLPQIREVLPPISHRFLFQPGSADDMRRAIAELLQMTPEEKFTLQLALVDRAYYLRPSRISLQLGSIFDSLLNPLSN